MWSDQQVEEELEKYIPRMISKLQPLYPYDEIIWTKSKYSRVCYIIRIKTHLDVTTAMNRLEYFKDDNYQKSDGRITIGFEWLS